MDRQIHSLATRFFSKWFLLRAFNTYYVPGTVLDYFKLLKSLKKVILIYKSPKKT